MIRSTPLHLALCSEQRKLSWASTVESHRALLLVHNLRELQHTPCCGHVRGESQCGEGDEVAAEDGDGRGNLLVAAEAAEHRHDLAMIILDVDKCDDHVDCGSRR